MEGTLPEVYEINSRDRLEVWLKGKPRTVAQVIAARAALRVLPLAIPLPIKPKPNYWLSAFRVAAIAWTRASYPSCDFRSAAAWASKAARGIIESYSDVAGTSWIITHPSDDDLVIEGDEAGDASWAIGAAVEAALGNAEEAVANVVHAVTDNHEKEPKANLDLWASVTADVEWLDKLGGESIAGMLARERLWINEVRGDPKYRVNMPLWARVPLDEFADSADTKASGFEPWIRWYRTRLVGAAAGGFLPQLRSGKAAAALDVAVVLQLPKFWDRDASEVNADIKRLAEEALRGIIHEAPEAPRSEAESDAASALELTVQRPAAFRFGVRDGHISVLPEDAPPNITFAADIRTEVLRKAKGAQERLVRTQAPQRAIQTLGHLVEVLGEALVDIRPGLLRSRARSLEADIASLSGELMPDALAHLRDLWFSVQDLQACFPYIREVEAEALALGLQQSDATAAHDRALEVAASAQDSDIPLPEAKRALTQLAPDIAAATDEIIRTRLIADNLLVVRNFTAAVLRHLYDHAKSGVRRIGDAVGEGAKSGITKGTEAVVLGSMAALAYNFIGPVGALAFLLKSFGPVSETAKHLQDSGTIARVPLSTERDKGVQGNDSGLANGA